MTEAEWLACADPTPMLEFLRGKASDRKLRLFACASFRFNWHLLENKQDRHVIRIAELYADGAIGGAKQADAFIKAGWGYGPTIPSYRNVNWSQGASRVAMDTVAALTAFKKRSGQEDQYARTLREITGPIPFRMVILDSACLSSTVRQMARTIYDDRRFNDLPVLADALEEAGCTEASILEHCRSAGVHVRGCWVVDLVLGKE